MAKSMNRNHSKTHPDTNVGNGNEKPFLIHVAKNWKHNSSTDE